MQMPGLQSHHRMMLKNFAAHPKHCKANHSPRRCRHSAQLASDDTSCSSPATNSLAVAGSCTESANSGSDTEKDECRWSSHSYRSRSENSRRKERDSLLVWVHPVFTSGILLAFERLDKRLIPKPEKLDVFSGNRFEKFQ